MKRTLTDLSGMRTVLSMQWTITRPGIFLTVSLKKRKFLFFMARFEDFMVRLQLSFRKKQPACGASFPLHPPKRFFLLLGRHLVLSGRSRLQKYSSISLVQETFLPIAC